MSSELTFRDRFKAVGGEQPHAWGSALGLEKSFIANCLRGTQRPQKKNLDKLVRATGIPEEWWLHGELPPPPVVRKIDTYERPDSADPLLSSDADVMRLRLEGAAEVGVFAQIPFYDVRASAGHGAFVADQAAARHYAFDREWLAVHVGIPVRRLALIPVSATSMEPDLHDGDLVMIDRGDIEVLREGVYVFELDDRLYVKRLALRGDSLVITSSNGHFPPDELNRLQEKPSFKIHGRVLGSPSFKRL